MAVAVALTPQARAHTTACEKAKVALSTLDGSLRLHLAEHGKLPPQQEWISALVRARAIRGIEDARDPWGYDYVFLPGHGNDYDLRSVGPDGELGTDDDLVRANGWKSPTCRDPSGCGSCRASSR